MNRNVSIVVILLVLVVIAGYLIWLRSKVTPSVTPRVEEVQITPSPTATAISTPSATPGSREATGSTGQRTSTPSSTRR